MNRTGKQDYEEMYRGGKKEYDQLLEKNQNDLVRIKIKEKTLNVTHELCRRGLKLRGRRGNRKYSV